VQVSDKKYFTSVQVLFCTLIGGFFAGIYMIAKNYENFEEISNKRKTFIFGLIAYICIWLLLLTVEMSEYATMLSAVCGATLAVFNRYLFGKHGLPLHIFFFKELLPQENRQSARHIIGAMVGGLIITLVLAFVLSNIYMRIKIGF